MSFSNRKWVILTSSEAESIDFTKVLESSAATLRWNNDNTKTFVKYEGSQPSFLSGKAALNYAQILTELEGAEWTSGPAPAE